MTKLKTPFLSLDASGTIGSDITVQRRNRTTFARTKPIPTYRRTLPQVYQRWLYEDYAYLWTQQTITTKRQYAAAGSRFHLTGFQYWMKIMLSTLPDIAGGWHLDERSGASAKDFSKNNNNGTIYGASPIVGLIDHAFYFDGINDYVGIPHSGSLNVSPAITVEAFIKITAYPAADWTCFVCKGDFQGWGLRVHSNHNAYATFGVVPNDRTVSFGPLSLNTWYHLVATALLGGNLILYLNGLWKNQYAMKAGAVITSTRPVDIGTGKVVGVKYFNGLIDEVRLYKRTLDATEILRHSLRRYPPQ